MKQLKTRITSILLAGALVVSTLETSGCRSTEALRAETLQVTPISTRKLPNLKADFRSLKEDSKDIRVSQGHREDPLALSLFHEELRKNCDDGPVMGSIRCTEANGQRLLGYPGFVLLTTYTCCTSLIFGAPEGTYKYTSIALLEVQDVNGNTVKAYTAEGKSELWLACYWGYAPSGDTDAVGGLCAFKNALESGLSKLLADSDEIRTKLESASSQPKQSKPDDWK